MSVQRLSPYREGTWFAVPLRTNGYAVGVVAREHEGLLLCYFFGPPHATIPALQEVERLGAVDAIRALRVADIGLMRGKWPIIGHSHSWNRSQWPMPVFGFRDPLTGKDWRRYYSDTDPSELIREEPQAQEGTLESGTRRSPVSVENILSKAFA